MQPRRRQWALSVLASLAALSSYASIQITGLQSVTEDEARQIIAPQLSLVEKAGAGSRPIADDASYFLERGLRRKGFNDADVRWTFDESTRNITLVVDEGSSRQIGEITVSGNIAEIPEEDIRGLVRRTTSNRLRSSRIGSGGQLPFVESEITGGLAEVSQLYRSLGYWEATTAPLDQSTTERDGTVDVHVQIEAGTLHHFREFIFTGDTANYTAELQALLEPLLGEPCTTDNVNSARSEVTDFFSTRGYYRHEIEVTPRQEGKDIALVFDVTAGKPFQVREIRFEGNERVKSSFLEKRFDPLVGEPFSPQEADDIYREILELGLFNKISVTPEESSGDGEVDLLVSVEEAKTRSVGVFGGFGSYEGAILGFILREHNLFGIGRQFSATAEYNQRGLRGDVELDDRWFLESPYSFNAKLFALTEDREGYSKFEYGGRVGLHRDIGQHYSITAFATMGYTDITDAEIEAADLGLPNYRVGSIGLGHSYDRRDNPSLPTRGFIFDNTIEFADGSLASEVDFVRGTVRLSGYLPITDRIQLSLGARSGFIKPTGDTDEIPIDLRFFSGGASSVRSFREKHMGPRDREGYPLGGEFYTTFNAELTVPIAGGLKAAVFADAGNLLSNFDDASFEEMHYAVGAGLRYDLPTGPIRLDYGYNLNRGSREPSGTVHISVGVAF